MSARTDTFEGLPSVVLTTEGLTAVILPTVGAKIISLVSHRTGREFIWRDPRRPLAPVQPGSSFAEHDISGIDDCFPTIDPCVYPLEPFTQVEIAGHGDVWGREWEWKIEGDTAHFSVTGTALPFQLQKSIKFNTEPLELMVDYQLSSSGDYPLSYQWAAHPLLRAEEGMRIVAPAGTPASTRFSTGGRLAVDDAMWSWPEAPTTSGAVYDVSVVGRPDEGVNEKYWLESTDDGCQLQYIAPAEHLHIDSDAQVLPWMAVCVNYGGWPDTGPGYWVAVEPSTSPWDALTESQQQGHARQITADDMHRWWWSLSVSQSETVSGGDDHHDHGEGMKHHDHH